MSTYAHVMEVVDALSGARGPVGHRVAIAGGGISGADLALELAEDGHDVTIVERTDVIAADMLFAKKISLLRGLMENHVRMITGHTVTEIDDTGLTAVGAEGIVHVDADTVVMALGGHPATSLADALGGRGTVPVSGGGAHPGVTAGVLAAPAR